MEGTLWTTSGWTTSGWTADTFRDSATALTFLHDHGTHLRAAVLAGAINLVFAAMFTAGLAAGLAPTAPTRAAAVLYLGIIGIAGRSLVPLGLWVGVPTFADLATGAAAAAWGGYAGFQAAAGAVGALWVTQAALPDRGADLAAHPRPPRRPNPGPVGHRDHA